MQMPSFSLETKGEESLTVGDVATKRILQCDHEESVAVVARRMHQEGRSSIIVMRDGEAVGIWTERDALVMDFTTSSSMDAPIGAVMSAPIKTVSENTSLHEVSIRFRNDRVRHYLVIDAQQHPVGVITQTDVVLHQGIEHYLQIRTVECAITKEPRVLHASADVALVSREMRQRGVDAVLVHYDDGELGIITERDILRLVAEQRLSGNVGALASRPLISVDSSVSLYQARSILLSSKVRHIGVINSTNQRVIGIVSFSDILSGIELVYLKELKEALDERNQALSLSRRSLQLADRVIEASLEGIMITDAEARIVSVNPAFSRMTGYQPNEVIGQRPSILSSGLHDHAFYAALWGELKQRGEWQGEVWNRRKDGEVFPERLTIAAIRDDQGQLTHYAALFSDISELKRTERQIRHLAYYDPLTDLPNRRLFHDRLEMAIAHAHRSKGRLALIFVDLDRFKRINDSLGHEAGDRVLRQVGERLLSAVREDDTVARLGGDEFVIMLSDLLSVDAAVAVARNVLQVMGQPLELGRSGEESVITCSLGISLYPEDGKSAEELIRNADSAMYRAKDVGRNNFQLYSPEINARSLEHLAMENNLRHAMEQQQLQVFYQPILSAHDERVHHAEALLRWHHPDLGNISPADFIPLAEETGMIIPIGDWVLESACAQLRDWQAQGLPPIGISVNVSALQFHAPDYVAKVREILERHQIETPSAITLELTESMLVEDALETMHTMNALRELGVCIDLDDFGTGYSSLSYLKHLPISRLKIDRAFVRGIHKDRRDSAIAAAIIQLAHSLGLEVVAEGVEREAHRDFLRANGSEWLQGFFYGGALPAEEFAATHLKNMKNL